MASDSWRYPWTKLPDYMGPGTPVEQYMRKRADLTTEGPARPIPAATRNAVSTATEGEVVPPATWGGETNRRSSGTMPAFQPARYTAGGLRDPFTPPPGMDEPAPQASGVAPVPERVGMRSSASQFNPFTPTAENAGAFDPAMLSAIREAQLASAEAFKGRGIADMWRGRQFGKRADRMLAGMVALRNADIASRSNDAAMISALARQQQVGNEIPLARLRAGIEQRGQDISARGQDISMRGQDFSRDLGFLNAGVSMRTADMQDATQRLGIEAGLLPKLPTMQRELGINRLLEAGDYDTANTVASLGNRPAAEKNPVVTSLPTGLAVTDSSGRTTFRNFKQLEAESSGAGASRSQRAQEELDRQKRLASGG